MLLYGKLSAPFRKVTTSLQQSDNRMAEKEKIKVLQWASRSPNSNLIEMLLWD